MKPDDQSLGSAAGAGGGQFATTHWSVVLQACAGDSPRAKAALGQLYMAYWYPLYAYVRGRGSTVHEAQDLTQDFFASLLTRNHLALVNREKGRFRSYLLGAFKHFPANEWHKANRQKRGGDFILIALDQVMAENRYCEEPVHDATPEKIYERNWASVLLERVIGQLRAEYQETGKSRQFEEFKVFLSGDKGGPSYASVAGRLEMTEGAVKVAVHRLRQRYREVLRAEIASTVAHPGEIEDEARYLLSVFRG